MNVFYHIKNNARDYILGTLMVASVSTSAYGMLTSSATNHEGPLLRRVNEIQKQLDSPIEINLGELSEKKSQLEEMVGKSTTLKKEMNGLMKLEEYKAQESYDDLSMGMSASGFLSMMLIVGVGNYLEYRKDKKFFETQEKV